MKVAFCLFGQPRDYKRGYSFFEPFLKRNQNVQFDFFFHAWKIPNGTKYKCAPWRNIPSSELIVEDNEKVLEDLKAMYNPIAYTYEDATVFEESFQPEPYISTIAYRNTKGDSRKLEQVFNIISQLYSRNRIRDLFANYIHSTGIQYDAVIISRFDFFYFPLHYDLTKLNLKKVNMYRLWTKRKIIFEPFLIVPVRVFLVWFNMYDSLPTLLNDVNLELKLKLVKETYILNSEEIHLAAFLQHFSWGQIDFLDLHVP
jgi:hypothetical protein